MGFIMLFLFNTAGLAIAYLIAMLIAASILLTFLIYNLYSRFN
jgi:hypothetical protein